VTPQEFIAQGGIREQDFVFTVEVRGNKWDVYHFRKEGKPGTMAYRKTASGWIIGIFCAGYLTTEQAVRKLEEGTN